MTLQPRHISFALLLHAVLLALLLTSFQCSRRVQAPPMVQGVLINASKLPVPVAPAHPAQQPVTQPQPDVDAQLKEQQAQAEAAQQKAQQEAAQQKAQQEAVLRQQQIEQQRKADELKQQQAAAAEAQRHAQLKQQQEQEEAQRKAEALRQQQAEEEQKRAAEQARQQAQQELQKQLEAEAQKRQAAAAAKHAAERKRALAEMQDQLGVEDAKVRQQEQLSWDAMLVDAIEKVWSRPAGLQGLYCTIHVELAPSGQVLSASVTKSSGNSLFDQSAVSAVYTASPLPLPQDMSAFQPSFSIVYDPDQAAPQ